MGLSGQILWKAAADQPARWVSGELGEDGTLVPGRAADRWIIPGLVDVHSHLSIGESGPVEELEAQQAALTELRSGVLVIREPGSPSTTDPLASYDGPTPLMIRSGRHLALPKRYLPGLAIELEDQADLPRVIAEQAAGSDGWVKLVGDWIDRSNGPDADLDPLWDRAILIDAVRAAHEAGARVAVHAFSRPVIEDLLEAGVDSIEHGSGMVREHAQEAAHQGIAVTPTLGQIELFPEFAAAAGRKYPRYAQTMQGLFEGRHQWFANLIEVGVQLLPGTDAGGYQPHGQLHVELGRWLDYGVPSSDVLDLATWRAREYLGVPSLEPGAPLDAVVYDRDPTEDVQALAAPVQVIRSGQTVSL